MGTVVFSIDAELAWGFHDLDAVPTDRLEHARSAWSRLLNLFDRYEIPATWAVVGHLMLDACDGEHAEHPAPPGWFEHDPGGSATDRSQWFAPDLVRAIQDAEVDHELASHSFSHLPFGAPNTTAEMIDAELAQHRQLADAWNEPMRSFVFPRNDVASISQLSKHGFRCYRGRAPNRWYDESRFRPMWKATELVLGRSTPPLVKPEVESGSLVNIPASLDLFGFEGTARRVVEPIAGDPIVAAARRGIEAAANTPGWVFHGWLHPNNLTRPADFERMDAILAATKEADVAVKPMGTIAQEARLVHAP